MMDDYSSIWGNTEVLYALSRLKQERDFQIFMQALGMDGELCTQRAVNGATREIREQHAFQTQALLRLSDAIDTAEATLEFIRKQQ